jgi:5-(carboxyamino)imidazole ribonucleotide mutase
MTPLVGVIMGSDSDWPTMQPAARALTDIGV